MLETEFTRILCHGSLYKEPWITAENLTYCIFSKRAEVFELLLLRLTPQPPFRSQGLVLTELQHKINSLGAKLSLCLFFMINSERGRAYRS